MKSSIFAALAFGAIVALGPVIAADKPDTRTPLERYRGDGAYALLYCSESFKLARSYAEGGHPQDKMSDYSTCISENVAKAKDNCNKALRTVKKPKAQEALKSYQVALTVALQGIRPEFDERQILYEQRQQALKSKLAEAWARFEIEQ